MSQPKRSLTARLVLFVFCLMITGMIMPGALSESGLQQQQQDLQSPASFDEVTDGFAAALLPPECDDVQMKCWVEGRTAAKPCFDECSIKHKGDIIGEAFCDGWCKTHVSNPVRHACMVRNHCAL